MPSPSRRRSRANIGGGPHPLFNEAWYRSAYPDVAAFSGTPWEHFTSRGDAEGRRPGPEFDPEFYRRTYIALEEHSRTAALRHFTRHGSKRGYLPRQASITLTFTQFTLRAAIGHGQNTIILVGNDAQQAGAPILLLKVAENLRDRGLRPVFLLQRGGPLLDEYRSLGPALVLDEGWSVPGIASVISSETPVLANTCWSAPLLSQLDDGVPSLLLLHEMAQYIDDHDLTATIRKVSKIAVSMPGMQGPLAERLDSSTQIRVIRPGLLATASTARERKRVRQKLGPSRASAPVFISAGYADHRKGFDRFVDAARAIHSRMPTATFVWLGAGSRWARLIASEALQEGLPLVLPGFEQNPTAWYEQATVYLLTSRQDPGPTTVMDAARIGVPFVGFESDIGLRSLDGILSGVGSFVADDATFAETAIKLAQSDSPQARRARAAHMESISAFDTYVDELLQALAEGGAHIAPSPPNLVVKQARKLRSTATGSYLATAHSLRLTQARLKTWARARWKTQPIAPLALAAFDRPPVGQNRPPQSFETSTLRAGQRAWLASAAELHNLRTPATLILGRSDSHPDPILLHQLEAGSVHLRAMAQFDAHEPPAWVTAGGLPPRLSLDTSMPVIPRAHVLTPTTRPQLQRPIGVFAHIFHEHLAEQLLNRIALITHDTQLYVSTNTEQKAEQIRLMAPHAEVRILENRGRDIYPKLYGFHDVYGAHDLVLHVHAKLSSGPGARDGWAPHILDRLLPSADGVDALLALFAAYEKLGMISPSVFPGIQHGLGWGPNRALAEAVLWKAGWPALPSNKELRFPAGSMFWARTAALKPLLDLDLPAAAFSVNAQRRDATLAHALERLLGVSCHAAGLTQIFVDGYAPGGPASHASIDALRDVFGQT